MASYVEFSFKYGAEGDADSEKYSSEDLIYAAQVQRGLLPRKVMRLSDLQAGYHYSPSGLFSGDCCDIFESAEGLFFLLGDVSGKGIAASILMSHLQATFRGLATADLSLGKIIVAANQIFLEIAPDALFATLVAGRIKRDGVVEFVNAGHLPLLHLGQTYVKFQGASGLPLGMFSDIHFPVHRLSLGPGETLVLYTDGLTEACNSANQEFGMQRTRDSIARCYGKDPSELIFACLSDLNNFAGEVRRADDLTILAIQRTNSGK
jgi:sigma-B regulation protein RsbU (phosphoserine phosphatase)